MHTRKLSNKDWQSVEEQFEMKLSGWKGKLLSVGGHLVLINWVLSSLLMFMMSLFEVPKGYYRELNSLDRDSSGRITNRRKNTV
jgi:hypothetical protein